MADNGTGPYGGYGGGFFLTWQSSGSWDEDGDLFFLSQAGVNATGFYPGYSDRSPAPNYWTTSIVKMQTSNAAGTVRLRSTDPRQAPEINFTYFSIGHAEEDLQVLADGCILLMSAYDAVGTPYERIEPDPSVDMRQAIVDQAFSHHAASSCRMGPAGRRNYCVDSKFRVNGVDNLRVVDASVLPWLPGAMPNGPIFTIS